MIPLAATTVSVAHTPALAAINDARCAAAVDEDSSPGRAALRFNVSNRCWTRSRCSKKPNNFTTHRDGGQHATLGLDPFTVSSMEARYALATSKRRAQHRCGSPKGIFSPGYGFLLERQQRRLHQAQKPSLWGMRRIIINPSSPDERQQFPRNRVTYDTYTIWNFLLICLWRFIHRLNNICLFILVILEMIAEVVEWRKPQPKDAVIRRSLPASFWALCWTLTIFVACETFTMYQRRSIAHERNNRICSVQFGEQFVNIKWSQLCVGHVIQLRSGEEVPADVVLLRSSDLDGVVFVDTQLIDGESQLKRRVAVQETQRASGNSTNWSIRGRLCCECPNGQFEEFSGTLNLDAHPRVAALDANSFVLQGSKIYGVTSAIAVVVYTGHQTCLAQQSKINCRDQRSEYKLGSPSLAALVFALCLICGQTLINSVTLWGPKSPSSFIVFGEKPATFGSVLFQSILQLTHFLSLSYSVILDITHLLQGFEISCMTNSAKRRSRLYNARSSDALGRVDFLITDKTGTLTDGLTMTFACCSVGGRVYGHPIRSDRKGFTKRHQDSSSVVTAVAAKPRTTASSTCSWRFFCRFGRRIPRSCCRWAADRRNNAAESVSSDTSSGCQDVIDWDHCNAQQRKVPTSYDVNNTTQKPSQSKKSTLCGGRRLKTVNADFFECAADDSCAVSAVGSLDAFDESAEVQRLERSFRKTLLTSKESRRLLVSQNPKRAFRVMFQALHNELKRRVELHDERLLRDSVRMDGRGRAVRDMLLAMTLCNSVVPSSDVFNLLVRPRANATDAFSPAARDRSRRSSQDSPPNSPPPLSRSVDEEDLSVDDFISCPVPEHVAEERLWAEQLCWNDMVLGTLTYQAQYPEEECIVAAACLTGYRLLWRSSALVIVENFGSVVRHEVLGCNAFTSNRQRMSIVVRQEHEDTLYLYCKGSDMAVLPLCTSKDPSSMKALRRAERHVRRFAQHGLRTLVFARRCLTRKEQETYLRLRTLEAASMGHCYAAELQRIVELFETDLQFLGVTGVREKVAPGAADTIRNLTLAGVRLWMMTGDYAELALHIAYASKLLLSSALVFRATLQAPRYASHSCRMSLRREVKHLYERFRSLLQARSLEEPVALLVNGSDVSQFLSSGDLRVVFCSMICCSDSVIFCRMTPELKARVIRILKTYVNPAPIVLAIGDGANDIPMLQEADCGVAVGGTLSTYPMNARSCDILLPSVRELKFLLLVHGRLFRLRSNATKFWMYFDGGVFIGGILIYDILSDWSLVEIYRLGLYILADFLFMSLTAIVHAATYKDVPDAVALELPLLYILSRRENVCNSHLLLQTLEGIFVSVIMALIIMAPVLRFTSFVGPEISVTELDVDVISIILLFSIMKLILSTSNTMSRLSIAICWASVAGWYMILLFGSLCANPDCLLPKMYYNVSTEDHLFLNRSLSFWIRQPYLIVTSFVVMFTLIFVRQTVWPTALEKVLATLHHYSIVDSFDSQPCNGAFRSGSGGTTLIDLKTLSDMCNPLKQRQITELLPLPKQFKLIYPNSHGRALFCTLPLLSDIDRLTVMLKLKRRSRARFLEEQLEVPSFELLPMILGLRFTVRNFRPSGYRRIALQNARSSLVSPTDAGTPEYLRCMSVTPDTGTPRATTADDGGVHHHETSNPELDPEHLFPRNTGHIMDALYLITLKFRDQQLESDYQATRQQSVRELRKPYRWILLMYSILAILVFIHDMRVLLTPVNNYVAPRDRFLSDILPDITVFFCAFVVLHYFLFTNKLDVLLRCLFLTSAIVRLLADYVCCRNGIASASVFSVLVFVVLRIPFFHALIYNCIFTALFCIRYLYSARHCFIRGSAFSDVARLIYGQLFGDIGNHNDLWKVNDVVIGSQLVHFLPLFFGIQAFTGFVGYRLEYNQRRRFFFDYQLELARRKQRDMLNTMLPSFVVDEYLSGAVLANGLLTLQPEDQGTVSVIFCDVHGFQNMVVSVEPTHLVQVLDSLFLCFDKCAERHHGTKIETVFETYLAATGLKIGHSAETWSDEQHAHNALEMALGMLEIARCVLYKRAVTRKTTRSSGDMFSQMETQSVGASFQHYRLQRIRVKIGIHSGSVISGVVGVKKPQYSLFGDTVNTASRMKATGKPDKIHVSKATHTLLQHDSDLEWDLRSIEVKGIGKMDTYLLRTPTPFATLLQSHLRRPSRRGRTVPSTFTLVERLTEHPAEQRVDQQPALQANALLLPPSATSERAVSSLLLHPPTRISPKTSPFPLPPLSNHIIPLPLESPVLTLPRDCSHETPPAHPADNQAYASQATKRLPCCFPCLQSASQLLPFNLKNVLARLSCGAQSVFGGFKFLLRDPHRFDNPSVEALYRQQYYANDMNINTIEQALLLFVVVFVVETWVVLHVPREHLFVSFRAIPKINWVVRSSFCVLALFFWAVLRHRSHHRIAAYFSPQLLVGILNLIFLTAGCTFLTVSVWGYGSMEVKDAGHLPQAKNVFNETEMGSGLLFRQVLWLSLVLVLVCLTLFFVDGLHRINATTICITITFLCTNLISTYLKESVDRAAFAANEAMKLAEERAKELLQAMLPRQVLREFQQDALKLAYKHEGMSFLFADICHFTPWAKHAEAKQVVRLLQQLFCEFDHKSTQLGLYKLCTIGDAYVAVTEPVVSGDNPAYSRASGAQRILAMANSMVETIRDIRAREKVPNLSMRIGIHCGECLGGVIGSGRLRYDLWGIDVLTANMMETAGVPERSCVSDAFRIFLNQEFPGQFHFTFHKTVSVIGKPVDCYLLPPSSAAVKNQTSVSVFSTSNLRRSISAINVKSSGEGTSRSHRCRASPMRCFSTTPTA